MSEIDTIQRTHAMLGAPITVHTLVRDLAALGLKPGMTVLVHSSLSALGWVSGGPVAVILALEEVLTPDGTLVMPAHSGGLSDPARWQHPPVPESWWDSIRQTMPAFDPAMTPTREMGVIADTFRGQTGVLRSNHPGDSFAAWGKQASYIIEGHSLDYSLGEASPLARLYDLNGSVLLLGVGHGNNTSLHLAENRASFPGKSIITCGAPLMIQTPNGSTERAWVDYQDLDFNEDDFVALGAAFEATGAAAIGRVGCADCRLMPQRPLVDFGTRWMEENRSTDLQNGRMGQ